ncbi:APC family permease [Aeromicrobium chenweiae]|uniref:Uncharacterized protein n=1 Tax=Aeromicrobium chenweiae TaxID=2079793 RepID=A0A2S0WPP9_9ACTN|nr:APC family permease [Aeromicrobium chenweiae]AWB93319.1 hypothetical protein C3E78_14485 [Aeromicrobium chenweiae]TGN34309.1 APC family permease [Aeromicrobium chenweiae]
MRGDPRPETPEFGRRSAFEGLARRQVGRRDLVAHSVAVLTPSLSALGTGLALPSIVGPGFWISTVLGFGLAALLAVVFDQFSSRFTAAGSLYTYVAKGLGATVALIVGVALVLGYGILIGFGLTGGARRFEGAWTAVGGSAPDNQAGWILVLLSAATCLLVMRRGIRWSTRAAFGAETVSILLLLTIFSVWVVRYGMPSAEAFSLSGASVEHVLAGAGMIAALTVAFESCASLGLETERPQGAVPAAMRTSLLVTGGLFLTANLVGTLAPPDDGPLWNRRWFNVEAQISWPDAVALVILGVSLLALALCAWTALSRLLFSFAREGIVWSALGRTGRGGVPVIAMWCILPLALLVPFAAWVEGGSATAVSGHLLGASTTIMCVAYACAALALVPFLRTLDEVRARAVVASGLAFLGVSAVAAHRVVREAGQGSCWAAGLLGGVVVAGLAWRLAIRSRMPQGAVRVGAHDVGLVHEVLLAGGPEGKELRA